MRKKNLYVLLCLVVAIAGSAPADPAKIACVGNSITAGYGVDAGQSYPDQLQRLLGSGYTVKNEGVSGTTMLRAGDSPYWVTPQFGDVFAFKPNIITIKLGTNDSKSWNWGPHHADYPVDYAAMIDTFLTISPKPQIWIVLPAPAYSNGFGIDGDTIEKDIIPILRTLATQRSLPTIDCHTALVNHPELFQDGVHPTAVGADTIAHLFYRSILGSSQPIVLDNPLASPASVIDNATTSVVLSIDAIVQGTISSVVIDLTSIGGNAAVVMNKSAGTIYTANFSVAPGLAIGQKLLSITAADNTGHTLRDTIALTVLSHNAPLLVSVGKSVAVSSIESSGSIGANAVDNNLATRWSSAASDPQWISVDLGSVMPIDQVVLLWESAYGSSYQIQVSTDATNWTSVFSTTTGNGGTDSISFSTVNARYVRMYGTQRATPYGYSLYEFEIFSPPSGTTATKSARAVKPALSPKGPALVLPGLSKTVANAGFYDVKGQRLDADRVSRQAVIAKAR